MVVNGLVLLLGAAAAAAQPSSTLQNNQISPAAKTDLECFVLYAAAVGGADADKDANVTQAGSLGVMYFYGKLQVEALGLNLAQAIRDEAAQMDGDPHIQDVAKSCDAEFQRRGSELIDLGQELQQVKPEVSSSS